MQPRQDLYPTPSSYSPHPKPTPLPATPANASSIRDCTMYIYGCLRLYYYVSWQNFANMGSPANSTILVRLKPKFCVTSSSQSQDIYDLDLISGTIYGSPGPFSECQCAFVHTNLVYITSNVMHFSLTRFT